MEVVTAPGMLVIDEYLRNAAFTVGTCRHCGSSCFIAIDFVFSKIYTLPPQQQFGADAVRASLPSIDFYVGFDAPPVATQKI
jgi:hypothetical protein